MNYDFVKLGTFKEELKNRFLCIVEVDGFGVLCYIPSSCRLSNFIDMTDRTVLLRPICSEKARTKYEVFAVRVGKQFIVLHLSAANDVVIENLNKRRFHYLGKRKEIKRELKVDGYKCDAFIEDTRTVIEIKSILSLNKTALFPTVYSQRAIKQLESIDNLIEQGYQVCYLFISMNPNTTRIVINDEMEKYYQLITQCVTKGMLVKGYSMKYKDDSLTIYKEVAVDY